jgi:hypothetical protein
VKVELPYADGTLTASLPDDTRRFSSDAETAPPAVADLDAAIRDALASPPGLPRIRDLVHPIHGILATHPLKRLRHAGRVIVAGARDPHVPRHLGFDVAASVEDAIARAQTIHGRGATIGVVEQLAMPADPGRASPS